MPMDPDPEAEFLHGIRLGAFFSYYPHPSPVRLLCDVGLQDCQKGGANKQDVAFNYRRHPDPRISLIRSCCSFFQRLPTLIMHPDKPE
ncbi:hypothetical protein V8C40DRAFT_81973 [Trichoderma camerunense]